MNVINKVSFFSVVIPTLNAGDDFFYLLRQLRRQVNGDKLDILIVDSGSTDRTKNIAAQFGVRIIEIDPASFNHGLTRNLGIQEAKSDFVCLLTQDAIPVNEFFLPLLGQTLEKEGAAGVCARQIPRDDASPLVRRDLEEWLNGSPQKRLADLRSCPDFFSSSPMNRFFLSVFDNVASLIRKEVWKKIPFPEAAFAEDLEWAFRVICNGYSIVYEPEAMVVHSHERSSDYLYKRTFQDHYRLYEIFGVRTIPSRIKVMRSIILSTAKDWGWLMKSFHPHPIWLKRMFNVPRFAWASAWGQYRGAKTAASGLPIHQLRDV
ncbi:MAG: glycosyltransferase [Candidatus Omnitrophota bacterium]